MILKTFHSLTSKIGTHQYDNWVDLEETEQATKISDILGNKGWLSCFEMFKFGTVNNIQNQEIKEAYEDTISIFNAKLKKLQSLEDPLEIVNEIKGLFRWVNKIYVVPPIVTIQDLSKMWLEEIFIRLVKPSTISLQDAVLTSWAGCHERAYFFWRLLDSLWFEVWIANDEDIRTSWHSFAIWKMNNRYFHLDFLNERNVPEIVLYQNLWDYNILQIYNPNNDWLIKSSSIDLYFNDRNSYSDNLEDRILSLKQFEWYKRKNIDSLDIKWGKLNFCIMYATWWIWKMDGTSSETFDMESCREIVCQYLKKWEHSIEAIIYIMASISWIEVSEACSKIISDRISPEYFYKILKP